MAESNRNIWFRFYHGTVNDDKWPLVARKSGQSVAVVIAVWCALLECASQAEDRGDIVSFDPEGMNVLLGLEDGVCESILDAMSTVKNPCLSNNRIASWEKRQPKRERDGDNSAERTKMYRARKNGSSANVTPCDANVTPEQSNVTPCDALRREKKKEKENKEEEKREKEEEKEPSSTVGSSPSPRTASTAAPLPRSIEEIEEHLRTAVANSRVLLPLTEIPECAERYWESRGSIGWVDRNSNPIADWKFDVQGYARSWARNLQTTKQAKPAEPKPYGWEDLGAKITKIQQENKNNETD